MVMYFTLQFRMLTRQISDFGLRPAVGMLIAMLFFIVFSAYLFYKLEDAPTLYAAIGVSAVSHLSNVDRTSFLQLCFARAAFYRIRAIENVLVVAPFLLFLSFRQLWVYALVLLVLSLLSSALKYGNTWNFRLPTPFYRHPFEYIVGTRSYWLLILATYLLAGIAIAVMNFNLGVFAMLVLLFCGMAFNSVVENPYFVWVFASKPRDFLWYKILISIRHSLLLCAPVLLTLLWFFREYWYIIGLVQLLGMLLGITAILAKYSTFPRDLSLPKSIIVSMTIVLPPLLLVVLPFLYRQAIKNLQVTLL